MYLINASSPVASLFRYSISLTRFSLPTRYTTFMAQSVGNNSGKKLIRIDVSVDTVCPWCYIGKINLGKAMDSSNDQFDFEVRWHSFFLDSSAPKEGVPKKQFYTEKFGSQHEKIENRMSELFRGHGLEYDMSGLTGNTLDSHRLISFAAHQGYDKQNALMEELFLGYFTQGKYIGDRKFLTDAAEKVGLEGAAEFLEDDNKGLNEVYEDLEKYSTNIGGVPFYLVNGKHKLRGGQPPEVFVGAFQAVARDTR